VRQLVDQLLDSDATPEEVCGPYPDLLPEVRSRWRLVRRLRGDLDILFPPEGPDLSADNAALPQVPGFQVECLLGRGGMGVAYKARDLSLDRDVAVKLLQDGYPAGSPIARRFTGEAPITAQLQHPGVPAVYRIGALADGRPFLAMKLINGRTLAALLRERPDPAADRGRFMAVFEQICQAVGYAHAHNVIHRDLKPSNVMVGAFGEVQVMDWGLAKVLTVRGGPQEPSDIALDTAAGTAIMPASGDERMTLAGSLLGTPAFMPPEQANGAIDRIDARSDVFSLGGILCAVLTGRPPYAAETAQGTKQLAARARLDDAHARLADCGAESELVALCRRCLSPEPEDRPRDAGEVAAAVAALRAAAEERARRADLDRVRVAEQGKRRRVLLAASGALLVVLLAGLGVSLWQTRRAVHALTAEQHARRDEAKARDQAFAALRSMTAEVVEKKFAQGAALMEDDRAFLRGVIAQFDAFAAIKAEDAESRAMRAEGRLRVGTMRYRLGELKEAEKDYDEAVSISKQLSADFPARPEFRYQLATGQNSRGNLLSDKGRLTDAEKDYDQAVSISKQLSADFPARPEFRQLLASSHTNQADLLSDTGRHEEAEKDYNQAVSINKHLAADFPDRSEFRQDLARSHNNRGALRRVTGKLREAEEDFDNALNIQKRLAHEFPSRPDLRQDLAGSHNNRGVLLREAGRLAEAEKDYDQALSIRMQLAADFPSRPELRQDLAKSHNNRGDLLKATGRLPAAEEDFGKALSIKKQLVADFPSRPEFRRELANSHTDRGNVLRDAGRMKEAEQDYVLALSIRKQLVADFPNQPDLRNELAGTCVNAANFHRKQGNWAAAKRLLLEGRPHHLAALKSNPQQQSYRQFYHRHLALLVAAHTGLLEPEDAVRTAERRRDLGWDAPADAYYAACFLSLCAPIVAKHDELGATQRTDAVRFYGDAAMTLLRHAVDKGFLDVAHMKKDPDLDSLRQRDDFRTLVTELERMGK
jgi:serine/threonine protein kinase